MWSLSGADTATGTILNDDTVGISFRPITPNQTIAENAVPATVTYSVEIDQTLENPQTVTVQYRTVDGSANAGSDYADTTGTLTFNETSTTQDITVTIIDDAIYEPGPNPPSVIHEQFTLELFGPGVNGSIVDAQRVTTIDDNDHNITIAAIGSPVDEEPTEVAQFLIQATPVFDTGESVDVSYQTIAGSAFAIDDYTTTTGIVTLADGNNPFTLNVPIVNDNLHEPDETFTVEISTTAINATVTTPSAVMTITDHDYQVSITNLTVTEDAGDALFQVSLDRILEGEDVVSVSYSTSDGTAVAGSDYTDVPGGSVVFVGPSHPTLTAAPSPQSATVPIINDDIAEFLETFQVQLSTPSPNATIVNGVADGNIQDDDYTVSGFADISAVEGSTAQLTITLNRVVVGDPVEFDVSVTGGTRYRR